MREETTLQYFIDDPAEQKILNLLKETHEKDLSVTYTELHEMVKKASANIIYLAKEDKLSDSILEK